MVILKPNSVQEFSNFFHGGKGNVEQAGALDKKHVGQWYVGKQTEYKGEGLGAAYQRDFGSKQNKIDNAAYFLENHESYIGVSGKATVGAQGAIGGSFGGVGKASADINVFNVELLSLDLNTNKSKGSFIGLNGTKFTHSLGLSMGYAPAGKLEYGVGGAAEYSYRLHDLGDYAGERATDQDTKTFVNFGTPVFKKFYKQDE
jgi:hypothetical protein